MITLLALFEHYRPESTLVFCHTKKQCDEVAEYLCEHQIEALAIHGDLEQRERDQVLVRFSNNELFGFGRDSMLRCTWAGHQIITGQ